MPTSGPRTLADQLRSWSDEQLSVLLAARPDIATPAPADLGQLASRASTRGSVLRAADGLTWCELAVLDALVVSDGSASLGDLISLLNAAPESVRGAVELLTSRALIWGPEDQLRLPAAVADALGCPVSQLGASLRTLLQPAGPARVAEVLTNLGLRSTGNILADLDLAARELSDPTRVAGLLAEVPEASARMVCHLDEAGAPGAIGSSIDAVQPLLDRGLVCLRDSRHVVVPREVSIAIRGGHTTRSPVDAPPALALSPRDATLVARAAAGAAAEAVRQVEVLLERWGTQPPVGLRGGGVGVRDLKLAATAMQVGEHTAALLIETAAAAGLLTLGHTDELDAAWLPTEAYDTWLALPAEVRWQRLALAWLDNPRLTGLVGSKTQDKKSVNALAADLERGWAASTRREALAELAALAPGEVLAAGTGIPSLVDRLAWLRPRRPPSRAEAVAWTIEEAAALGVVGLGGLPPHGRALVDGSGAAEALAALLPAPLDHIVVQADLTAVAPGPLTQELGRRLAVLADVESRGGGTVYRFTESSLRRAFDAGWSLAEVQSFLTEASRTEIPQPLRYLVEDVSRRFGTVRVGAAESFVRSDDETALAALVHDPSAAALRLRRIAPTVVVSDLPVDLLLERLRSLGVAPVVEAPDGTILVAARVAQRTKAPSVRPRGLELARTAAGISAVIAAMRAGERAAAGRDANTAKPSGPGSLIAQLNEAVDRAATLWISYAGNDGSLMDRVVDPVRIDAGWLTAFDHRTEQNRSFALHRIHGVRPLA
ncbi:MAG: helicase-associated domain-containing protein [Nocardioidaceae bacterium]